MAAAGSTASHSIDRTGYIYACLGAVLFSFKAILAKLLYRHGVDATTIISLRMLFSGPVFLVIALIESHKASARLEHLARGDYGKLLVLGFLGYYLSSLLDFSGLRYVSASLERLILFLTPTAVALISLAAFKTRINARQWLGMLTGYLGVLCVFAENLSFQGTNVGYGSLLIFLAMLSYATYLVSSGEMLKRMGSIRLVAYVMCVSCGLTAIHFAAVKAPDALLHLPKAVYGLSLANALFCTIIPVYLTMFAVARIGATSTSQMSMLGPISLLFFGHWLLGESITAIQIIGTVLVLIGISVLLRSKPAEKAQDELKGSASAPD